jgi:hypothetical protein
MRLSRIVLAAGFAAVAAAAPAHAAGPDPDNYVTVTFNGPIVCVTEPCDQPPLVTVCVVPTGTCVDVPYPN